MQTLAQVESGALITGGALSVKAKDTTNHINVTGGEPCLHPGLPEIVPVTEFRDVFGIGLTNTIGGADVRALMRACGEMPLPPYIKRGRHEAAFYADTNLKREPARVPAVSEAA